MDGINWDDWLNREQLTLGELLLLSLEEDPNDKDLSFFDSIGLNNDEAYINRRGDAESWIRTGKLQGRRVNDDGSIEYFQIDPVRFFELAKSNNWDLAQEISDFLDKHQNLKNITWSGSIQPLEPLTDEQRQDYNKLAAWTWVDAIYILQGFKPCPQISTEQVRSHFINEYMFFTESIELRTIGKIRLRAGEKTFIDSPANWETFWQGINKPTKEQQTETVGSHAITEPKQKASTKLEKQQAAILKVIEAKKFKPMAIPDNEKGTIKLICESDYSKLFDAITAFDRAWKLGIKTLWQMENHESYARRGNN
ncbi:MAG: hypothetical protein Q8L79_18425 [Methylobacter sp.]|uniref:hypothetical protein n=1 Tax=Methylobacter sp. TaxID=2051955 RepID=UPI0027315136|nr:hypothetical protein [Methylobacter sp.]MDP1667085.1 hypothetical protein [Methylobacter sp.]